MNLERGGVVNLRERKGSFQAFVAFLAGGLFVLGSAWAQTSDRLSLEFARGLIIGVVIGFLWPMYDLLLEQGYISRTSRKVVLGLLLLPILPTILCWIFFRPYARGFGLGAFGALCFGTALVALSTSVDFRRR